MKSNFLIIIFFLILTNCGFKIMNNSINFQIIEITEEGDKKINYYLKNKLSIYSNKSNENLIQINIKTNKAKTIKEKNISDQITKYEIRIDVFVDYDIIGTKTSNKFLVSKSGFYNVETRHSETLENEKDLINLLINDLAEEILDNLTTDLNDI